MRVVLPVTLAVLASRIAKLIDIDKSKIKLIFEMHQFKLDSGKYDVSSIKKPIHANEVHWYKKGKDKDGEYVQFYQLNPLSLGGFYQSLESVFPAYVEKYGIEWKE